MRISKVISALCAVFLVAGSKAYPQSPTAAENQPPPPQGAVAAIVNDSVITTFDISQRMQLMMISAGRQLPPEALPQLQQQAFRDLIEEKIKLHELKQFELDVTEEELNQRVETVAAQSNLTVPELTAALSSQGIALSSLKQQLKTSMLWPQLVQGRFRDRIKVTEDAVEDTLNRMREQVSKEQYLVSEICIPVDDPSLAQQYYQGSMQLIEQMRQGVPFTVVAQQFSACTTAAIGGDLGWVAAGELEPELDNAIRDLPPALSQIQFRPKVLL